MLLERWRKAHNKQGVFQSIVAPSSPAVNTSYDDVIVVEPSSPQRDPNSPDSPIPVVQVTPVSPTAPANVDDTNAITELRAHEDDDEMPQDMRADVKHYLERRRHTIMANPCVPEQQLIGVPMQRAVPRSKNYSPEKRLPAPSIFQMQALQDRRASEGAASLASGISQFQTMHGLSLASQADNSRENLGLHTLAISSPPSPQASEEHDSGSDQEPDPEDVARYMRLRGHKRHTLAGASEIPPEIRLCQFPMKMQRRVRTPSRERVNREGSYVGVPGMSRYGARRASDGQASLLAFTQHLERKNKKGSLKEIHAEHQKLQQRFLNNGQPDVLKLQQQHQFHHQQQQHQQLPSPVQQRSQHPMLPLPPSLRRLRDSKGRRFSDGPENLAATLAEFQNQLSLSQQKKQLQSIESQHPLTISSHSSTSPGSLTTADFPMDEEMQERSEIFSRPNHLPDEQSVFDPGHLKDVIHPLPIPSPARADVYSPQTSPREMLDMLHFPPGAQPQEQLQQEMQRLQLEPMGGHLNSTNTGFRRLENALLANQSQGFQGPSSPESFPRPFLATLQSEEQFYEGEESPSSHDPCSVGLQYNAQGSPYHVENRGDMSPERLPGAEPFASTAINQHYLLQQNTMNQVNGHQEFSNPSFIPNTTTAPLGGDMEVRAFMDEQSPGSRPDHLTATSAFAATLNAEAGNSGNLAGRGGHHRRHHTVPNDETPNELLRQAQANNLYKRLPFNNNLITAVSSKEDILGEGGRLGRSLSPKGSLFTDPMIKLESTNGLITSPSPPNHMTLAFNMNMISHKSVRSILDEVRNTLDNRSTSLMYNQSDLLFTLQDGEVRMQIEVCRSPELAVNGLRLRRLGGNAWEYKRLCNELLSGMNL